MMPVWYPPTPPQGEGDIYKDSSLSYLYDWSIMLDSELPPVYIKRTNKRPRVEIRHSPDSCRPIKSHKREESVYAPRSLFERPSPALLKVRRDMKLQKYRSIPRPPLPNPGVKPNTILGWTILEDKCLLDAVKSQGLPLSLITVSPAHTPNWDLVADLVNNFSRIHRSARQCRYRYESEILPREEGKGILDANQKKQKKSRSSHKSSRTMRTSHLYEQDNNQSFTKDTTARHDAMKAVLSKKSITPKRRYDDPNIKNPKHVAVLNEYGINYDSPATPMDIAVKRADRIAKEKQKTTTPAAAASTEQVVTPARIPGIIKVPASPPHGTPSPSPTVVATTPRPAQRILQTTDSPQRPQRIIVAPQQVTSAVVKANSAGALPLNPAQLQYFRQQNLARHQMKVLNHAAGTQQANIVQQIGVAQQVTPNKITPVTLASIQMAASPQRPQLTSTSVVGKQTITRAVTEVEINALLKKQALAQQKSAIQQPVTQIFTTQQQIQSIQGVSGERVAVSVGGVSGVAVAGGTVNLTGTGPKVTTTGVLTNVATALTGKTPMKMATPQQIRQLQMQQQLALVQRKGQKVAHLTQIGGGAQVIVQAPGAHKALPQIQQIQLMRHIPQAGARVIPRQTIQVVGGSMGQVRATSVSSPSGAHQVILSQVSAALARLPTPLTTPTTTVNVRPAVQQPQPPPDNQPK